MRRFPLLPALILLAAACDSTPVNTTGGNGGGGAGGSSGGSGGSGGTAGTAGTGGQAGGIPPPPTIEVPCLAQTYECGDLIDNDGDGLIDYQDPDCLGPCDNTEDSFYGGIPGQPGPACIVDCYFDSDSGAGNDGCYWNHACDPFEVAPNYYPEPENGASCEYDTTANTPGTPLSCDELFATQAQGCFDYCLPLVPNGCDCFGCCELPAGSGSYVWLGSEDAAGNGSCSLADLADPEKCHPCTPVAGCFNGCAPCELCIGKTELPPECEGMNPECPMGVTPCGTPDLPECPSGYYCTTGCCQIIPN